MHVNDKKVLVTNLGHGWGVNRDVSNDTLEDGEQEESDCNECGEHFRNSLVLWVAGKETRTSRSWKGTSCGEEKKIGKLGNSRFGSPQTNMAKYGQIEN